MATINKDFKIKNGLIVEGSTATVNNYDILTKSSADTTYIQGLVGGVANSEAVANAIVLRDANASFAANVITADLVGDVTGQVSDISNFDTDDLTEGSNQYFTAQRAIDATVGNVTGSTYSQYLTSTSTSGVSHVDVNTSALGALYDAAGSADTAQTNAQNYADDAISTALYPGGAFAFDTYGSASTAQTNAQNYADGLAGNYDAAGSADTAQTNAQNYADSAVSALVDSAPELLNTLNELAAAIGDDANFATTLTNLVATKQDILTAGTGIDITGNTISADLPGLVIGSPYLTTAEDMLAGTVLTLRIDQLEAQLDTDGYLTSSDLSGYATETYADTSASTAQTNAQNYADSAIGALTTDDIEEGVTNEYFTDGRAKDSAADLLTNATLTNITITGTGSGLTITAENGVADSTTDDLIEGTSNLYFSNARAVSALEAVTPNFQSVDVTWVRREEATWTDVVTASTVTAHEFATSEGSVKYLVRVFQGGNSQVSEVLVTTDSSNNIAVLEYGTIYTSANPLATITADWDSVNSKYRLRVTTANNSSEILVAATMLAYND